MHPMAERNALIVQQRQAGETLKSIGLHNGISTERVRQIVAKAARRKLDDARRAERLAKLEQQKQAALQSFKGALPNYNVEDLELSIRALNCLKNANLWTVHEVASTADEVLLKIPNFGRRCLNEVREVIASLAA